VSILNVLGSQGLQPVVDSPLPTDSEGNPTVILNPQDQTDASAMLNIFSSSNTAPLVHPSYTTLHIDIQLNLPSSVSTTGASLQVPQGFRLSINGGSWIGQTPALTLTGGSLTVSNGTFSNNTNAPALLVTGGVLTLRDSTVNQNTGVGQPAIDLAGGAIDLGTATDPGGNTITINGPDTLLANATAAPVVAVGDTFYSGSTLLTTPQAANYAYQLGENGSLAIQGPGVLANDLDPSGNALTAVIASGPGHGTLALNPDGSFRYTPNANFAGTDDFTYRATRSDGTLSNVATVTLNVRVVASQFVVAGPAGVTTGVPHTFTVTAEDASGRTDTSYAGPVHFSSSDSQSVLPPDYTFTAADGGVHSFTVTFTTPGSQTVSATDTANSSTSGNATLTVYPMFTVFSTADSGDGSLRQAILAANAAGTGTPATPDLIRFAIPANDPGHVYYKNDGVAGSISLANVATTTARDDSQIADIDPDWSHSWWRIQPASNLPAITDPVIIDGYSQPGASQNTLGIGPDSAGHENGDGDNAVLRIELDGRPLSLRPPGGTTTYGLTISAGHSTVEGLVIHGFSHEGTPMILGTVNFSAGIQLVANGANHIAGNFIGTDVSGTLAPEGLPDYSVLSGPRGPMSTAGVVMQPGSNGNVIGTANDGNNHPVERNVISANVAGVAYEGASDNVVAGNFIGTDRMGMHALGNWEGVGGGSVKGYNTQGNLIGTNGTDVDAAGERNIISGNKSGILTTGGFAPADTGTVVAGNFIGTDVTGTGPLGNLAVGIAAVIGERGWTIGGADPALANTIAYNGFALRLADGLDHPTGPGIWVFDLLGLGAPSGIRIQGNSIHDNTGLGIDLGGVYPSQGPDGVTANDSEGHSGPNNFQDFPKLDAAYGYSTNTLITGRFDSPSQPGQLVTIDLYANTSRGHPFTDPGTGLTSYYGDGETYLGSTTVVTDPQGHASFTAVAGGNLAGRWISATATDPSGNTSEFSAYVQAQDESTSSQTFQESLQSALPNSPTRPNAMTLQATSQATADAFMAVFSSTNPSPLTVPPGAATTIDIQMNFGSSISVNEANLAVPTGFRVSINGGVWHGGSPALTLVSGSLTVSNATFVNATDAPTILVTGGSLTLRNDTIQESTGFSDAAIAVTGGTVDLGTSASPGGNVINVNGAGEFVHNTTANTVAAVGDSFQANGASLPPRDLSFTALTGSAVVPLLGDAVTFTATVRANTPGSAPPGGSVDFFDVTTNTDLGSAPLSGGTAALTTSALAVGVHVIWARYGGDDNFLLSQDSTPVTVIPPASLSGVVWEDFNDDGQVDFGERGIPGVPVNLSGTDDLGHSVNLSQQTDGDGAYVFLNLRPGNYYITEMQPAGYPQGIDSVGTAGGSLAATDRFFVQLSQGVNGFNYNYGERPPAGGSVQRGQAAGIGFWNNKNGQALIKALPVVTNADGSVTSVANWLAATLPNIFGRNAANDLTGQSNAAVAALFQADFLLKGVKLDAQVLATALSVYATNATLDSTKVAAQYGFTVSGDGAGTATVNVGSNGDAFGVADNTTMTVMDLLLATNNQAVNGLLYGGNTTRRVHANNVYSALNTAGGIG
jgi:hypothetical protein